jgi:hypothetical protein
MQSYLEIRKSGKEENKRFPDFRAAADLSAVLPVP